MDESAADDGAIHGFWAWFLVHRDELDVDLEDVAQLIAAVTDYESQP